jgi:dihydrofolate reductase
MRRIVVTELLSLDGVMEDPGGAEGTSFGGWTAACPDPDGMAYKLEEIYNHDAMLLGRVTYDGFAAAWPGRTDEVGFADRMNTMPKYVVSTTLGDPGWENSTVISGDVMAGIAALKNAPGGDLLLVGSRTVAQSLMQADLIDEYRLMVFPVILGEGKRLFGPSPATPKLNLVSSVALASGSVILTYTPRRTDAAFGPAV